MIIRDALYGDIEIEHEVIIEILSTYEFQRLRKIKQLGLTYFLFPTAEHTRFSHSIGVYHLSTRIIDVLELKQKKKFSENEALAFKLACLLHDIGHGAFSHTSEEVFNLHHEEFSIKIILDETTDINKVLKKHCPEIIEDITYFIRKKHDNKVLVSAISSTIDIDRMDYLMRDSYFAGVVYGQFDVERIIKLIDVVDDKMVFLNKGIRTLEDFIMSRYHMFEQVYLNHKTIGYEKVAIEILNQVKDLYSSGYQFKTDISKLEPFINGLPTVQEYIQVQDYYLIEILDNFIKNESDEKLIYLCEFFLLQKPFVNADVATYKLTSSEIRKTLYNETVHILMESGEIKRLEDVSPLVKFLKNDLKIEAPEMDFYV